MPPQETRPEAGSAEEPAETFGKTVEKFRKEWAAKRTTAVPPRVYDLDEGLGIDDALKSRIGATPVSITATPTPSPRLPALQAEVAPEVLAKLEAVAASS